MSPPAVHVSTVLERFSRLEAAGWKGRRGTALLHNARMLSFFGEMGRQMADRAALRVGFFSIGGQDAAGIVSLEAHQRTWVLKVGYDERWAFASPGLQLIHAAITDASRRGLSSFEFLGSAERWEERWNTERRPYCGIALYPRSLLGFGWLGTDLSQRIAKRLRRRSGARRKPA
jgi:CelD/BcsL family acetyltransferase involved in cellulose biosynthesis